MDHIPEIIRCPPVLVCGFARPDTLTKVFERIKEVKPSKLYLWLNCPRTDHPDEVSRNLKCKNIFSDIQWPCDVHRNYSTVYLECRESLETAFTWFFDCEERGIILEDDCVPDLSFFRFCGELLEKYKDDKRIGMIGGHVEHLHVDKMNSHGDSYYFDRCSSIWGWATWRRAWAMHDKNMTYYPSLCGQFDIMYGFYRDWPTLRRRRKHLWKIYGRTAASWDGAWFTTMQINNWLCVHPYVNLVSNIGQTQSQRVGTSWLLKVLHYRSPWDSLPTEQVPFPLQHPLTMMPNPFSERYTLLDQGQIHNIKWWLTRAPYYALSAIATYVAKIFKKPTA